MLDDSLVWSGPSEGVIVMLTRIAPTPSGRLHLGNAANALLVHWWAQHTGAQVRLRIDDLDSSRARPEYVEDILEVLSWLEIDWRPDQAPWWDPARDPAAARQARVTWAREELARARDRGLPAYACTCSRSQLVDVPTGGCPGSCRSVGRELTPGTSALRVAVPTGWTAMTDVGPVSVSDTMGDFVIWRRDDVPAYQWFSVVEDTRAHVTHVLRGADLRDSTAAQMYLAQYLDSSAFLQAQIRHHPLALAANGAKLSKSQLGGTETLPRDPATRLRVQEIATAWARELGIPVPLGA